MSFKEKFFKILYFPPKICLKLYNFMLDGETRKYVRATVILWMAIILGFIYAYIRVLIIYLTETEPVSTGIVFFVIGPFIPVLLVFWTKYVVVRLLCSGASEKPTNPDEKPVKYKYVNKKHK